MKIKLIDYDGTNFLKTQEDMDGYLKAAFEDGDTQLIVHALGDIIRAQNTAKFARDAKVDRAHLYRAFSKSDDPKFSTFCKVVSALGYKLSITRIQSRKKA